MGGGEGELATHGHIHRLAHPRELLSQILQDVCNLCPISAIPIRARKRHGKRGTE